MSDHRRRTNDEGGVYVASAEQRGRARLRLIARVPAGEIHGEREPGLPREHGIGTGAVAAPPEGGQSAPRGAVQGLGERDECLRPGRVDGSHARDRKSTRLNSSHSQISYAVFCLKKKKTYSILQ